MAANILEDVLKRLTVPETGKSRHSLRSHSLLAGVPVYRNLYVC